MPKQSTGTVRFVGGVWNARVRLADGKRPSFAMAWCKGEKQAKVRALQLNEIAEQLAAASVSVELTETTLTAIAAAATDRALHLEFKAAELLVGKMVRPTGAPNVPTFAQFAEQWTSGALAKKYPDQIREKRSAEDDEQRLRMYINPIIGTVAIDRVTLDMCEDVMRRLPAKLEVSTRRNVGQLVTRLLNIAVYPMRLIPMSPIPRGFLPKPAKRKALAHLYPSDDAKLLRCIALPLAHRILWGFLSREGMRLGEALKLVWTDLDLERGAVRLDKNKTSDPRAWAMQDGTAEALRVFRRRFRQNAKPDDRVFVDEDGRPFTESGALGLPAILREHLRAIGLHETRPELFESTDERRQLRCHDLRGSFVTIALANGRSEAWVSDRTGHRSSQMIARYKRTARTFAELQTGDLEPLDQAIPEFRNGDTSIVDVGALIGPRLDQNAPNSLKSLASPAGFEPASPT